MAQLRDVFAKNLKKKRRSCGLSQAALAEKVNVSTHHIAMIELTRNFPTSELIERIADALGIEYFELFIDKTNSQSVELDILRKGIKNDMQEVLENFFKKEN